MKNIFMRLPLKLSAAVLFFITLVSVGAISAALLGGDRQVKPYQGPGTPGFDYVTFNSFTGVPNIGDERNFFTGKIAGAPDGFYDPMNGVRNGDELLVRVYVHNNADPKHNADGSGVAKNTKVRVKLPTSLDETQTAHAYISADNANPKIIEDTLKINSENPIQLQYVKGSATVKTNFIDTSVSDAIVGDGVLIGDNNTSGTMRGCFEYVALVTFKVKVTAPNFSLDKKVRMHGTDTFTENVNAKAGDKVDFVLAFKNTGSTNLDNVVLGDKLPEGFTYVPGSTEWNSGHTGSKWVKATSDNITKGGVDVGNYGPNGAAYVRFTAQVAEESKLSCGANELVNHGYAKPKDQGTIEDTATVKVDRKCENVATYKCDLLKVTSLGNRKYRFDATASGTNGATIKHYTYDFGDGSQALVTDKNSVEHTYGSDKTFNASVKVTFTVNGQDKVAESTTCKATVNGTTTTTTTSLPDTGAGDVLGIFAVTTVAGALLHRFILSRRFL